MSSPVRRNSSKPFIDYRLNKRDKGYRFGFCDLIFSPPSQIFWHKNFKLTVFTHIIAAATILFWIHLVRKLFKFSFPLCNENLNCFLTRWGNYSRRENCSREETIWGNTVLTFNLNICFGYLCNHQFEPKLEWKILQIVISSLSMSSFFKNFKVKVN